MQQGEKEKGRNERGIYQEKNEDWKCYRCML